MRKAIFALLLALVPLQAAALDTNEILGLVAMPLAVNALSDISGISANELTSFVSMLNSANVAPVQVVEVLRYVPVALVDDSGPEFVQYVRTEFDGGLRSDAFVDVIVQRLRTYDVSPELATAASRVVYVEDQFVPAIVINRIAERRAHPHGGPPGQLKKQVGVQTGAEIVHGASRTTNRPKPQPPGQIKKNDRGNQGDGHGKGKGKGKGKP